MNDMAYDIFISYRRKGAGAGVAGEIQAKLENRGYRVFLDVDDIVSGTFPEQIEKAIKESGDFLLILSQGMLDRCVDEDDWVRREIVTAEQYGKNVIGVALPGFVMPEAENLPLPLRDLPNKQVFVWSHEYRNASIEKIEQNLVSKTQKKKRKKRNMIFAACGAALMLSAILLWFMLPKKDVEKPVAVEEEKVEEVVPDEFAINVHKGDSLLTHLPKGLDFLKTKEQYKILMNSIAAYNSAITFASNHPEDKAEVAAIERRRDSLMDIREKKIGIEFEAIERFFDIHAIGDAKERLESAKVLAVSEDKSRLETFEKKLEESLK